MNVVSELERSASRMLRSIAVLGASLGAAWLLPVGAADAIVFKGIIDPAFNASGTSATGSNLGWSAEILLELDGCGDATGLTTCTTMELLSATGTLYDVTDVSHTPISTPSLLTYYSGSPDPSAISSVLFDAEGNLIGMNTSPIGQAIATASSTYLPPNGTSSLWLQFYAADPGLFLESVTAAAFTPTETGGYLLVSPCSLVFLGEGSSFLCPSSPDNAVQSNVAMVTFTTVAVPEPGTLALLGSALGGIAFLRRRRR